MKTGKEKCSKVFSKKVVSRHVNTKGRQVTVREAFPETMESY